MSDLPIITGLGLVTPLGNSVVQTWDALLAGRFIRHHATCDTGLRPVPPVHARISHLATMAATEAIRSANWTPERLQDAGNALVAGTSKGHVCNWLAGESLNLGLAGLSADIARAVGHGHGPRVTVSAACASGLDALIHAVMLLRSGMARRALVVAAEASVHPLFLGSFKLLGVLPPEGVGCRPFDTGRQGFWISEAGAAVCLETDESARAVAAIDRFALAGDAYHLTGGDPSGRALRHVLGRVIDARPVDLVHAHATGTESNDPVELAAIESSVAGMSAPPVLWSHKGALGHSLGASGLVSVVLNCQSHVTNCVPGNVRTENPLAMQNLHIARECSERRIRRSVALAAGFGGAIAAVSLIGA